jgi:hypothetical protein
LFDALQAPATSTACLDCLAGWCLAAWIVSVL